MIAKKDNKDEDKNGDNNVGGSVSVTTKMYTVTMNAWAKSKRHLPFLFGGGGVDGGCAKDKDDIRSFGFKGRQHSQQ